MKIVSYRSPPDSRPVLRYVMKLTVTVFVPTVNSDAVERAKLGVRSALKMALEEGWI